MANPGWHPDPVDERRRRFFDGENWSPMVSTPGAGRPVWDPVPEGTPAPGSSSEDSSDGGPGRRTLAAAVAAVAVAAVVAAVLVLGPDEPEPVAEPGTCEVAETLIRQRVGTTPAPSRPVVEVLAGGPREGDAAGEGLGWPEGGRRWEGPDLHAPAPVDWAQRTWHNPGGPAAHQLVQRFESPAAAAVWDAAALRSSCDLDGARLRRHDLGPLSLSLTFEVPAAAPGDAAGPTSSVPPTVTFAQISHLDGQYRVVTWADGEGLDRRQLDTLAYEAAGRLRAR